MTGPNQHLFLEREDVTEALNSTDEDLIKLSITPEEIIDVARDALETVSAAEKLQLGQDLLEDGEVRLELTKELLDVADEYELMNLMLDILKRKILRSPTFTAYWREESKEIIKP